MPRRARFIIPEYLYHLTQRGNNRQTVFHENKDYILYLKRLEEYSQKYGVKIYAYCLMPNHVHLIAKPLYKDSFARMFLSLNMRYAQYFQKKTNGCGHVWQGRYFSCLLQGSHICAAIRYVEVNPLRANLVKVLWDYHWSSARFHLGVKYKWITLSSVDEYVDIDNWREYLSMEEEGFFLDSIRNATKKNLILGNQEYILGIEKRYNQKILPNPMGRPKK